MFNKGKFNFAPLPFDAFFGLVFHTTARIARGIMHMTTRRNAFLYERPFFEILRTIGARKNLPTYLSNNIDEW